MPKTTKLINLLIEERAMTLYLADHLNLEAAEIANPEIRGDARDRFRTQARADVERWIQEGRA